MMMISSTSLAGAESEWFRMRRLVFRILLVVTALFWLAPGALAATKKKSATSTAEKATPRPKKATTTSGVKPKSSPTATAKPKATPAARPSSMSGSAGKPSSTPRPEAPAVSQSTEDVLAPLPTPSGSGKSAGTRDSTKSSTAAPALQSSAPTQPAPTPPPGSIEAPASTDPAASPKAPPAANASIEPEALAEFGTQPPPVQQLIRNSLALTKRNLTYTYGSADPTNGGMDCSGAIYYVLREQGFKDVPRDASGQYVWARKAGQFFAVVGKKADSFEFSDLQPGDLLFWSGTYSVDRDPPVTHSMIYLGTELRGNKRVMFGSSDGRTYDGKSRWGVSVFDFKMPRTDGASAKASKTDFLGYARIPGLRTGDSIAASKADGPEQEDTTLVEPSAPTQTGVEEQPTEEKASAAVTDKPSKAKADSRLKKTVTKKTSTPAPKKKKKKTAAG
jgi:cell wall-associated NlpC family hydrolase